MCSLVGGVMTRNVASVREDAQFTKIYPGQRTEALPPSSSWSSNASYLQSERGDRAVSEAMLEILDEAECRRLIEPGGIGRLVFAGSYDLTVLPVNYKIHDGAILFRTAQGSATQEDLRTGISHAEFRVAFEVDEFDMQAREGWSVLVQGPAHHLDSAEERADAERVGIEPWPGGEKEHFIRISPVRITGRRIRRDRDA